MLRHTTMHYTILSWVLTFGIFFLLNGCSISYKFNGASIDYATTKTISVADFTNNAALVYAPLATNLTDGIKDLYQRQRVWRLLGVVETWNWRVKLQVITSHQWRCRRIVMQQKPS